MKQKSEKKREWNNKMTAMCGVLMALALVLSYLESLVPVSAAIPGVKLGLANMVTIIALRRLGLRPAIIISVGRIVISGVLFSNLTVIIYSLAGAAFSIAIMLLAERTRLLSLVGISICGGVAHNLGQVMVACLVMENIRIFKYMAVLAISGAISGALVGIFSSVIMKNIKI